MLSRMDSLESAALSPAAPRRKRAAVATAALEKSLICQPLPPWLALNSRAGETVPAFAAGALFLALDRIVRAEPEWLGVFSQRQALRAAAASSRLLRHREDEAALRDAHHWTRPGDDPGPAGKLYRLWRDFSARPARLAGPCLAALAQALGAEARPDAFAGLMLTSENPDPIAAALEAADACVAGIEAMGGETEAIAAMAADLALARRFGWPRPLPLFGAGGGRRAPAADRYAKILREALASHALAAELERRASQLHAAAATLRGRGADRGVAALLADDVVAAVDLCHPGSAHLGSDRAARRFLERLAELGAIRETTRRPTFRLYGI